MKPKISVIMPVLNGERFIDQALQSVVDQTYTDLELVVIDDGSTDGTPVRVDSFRDRIQIAYVRHEARQGIARSVNDGLAHARGDFIAFLDHDDAWLPDFLQTQIDHLTRHPDVGMVHSDFQTIDTDGNVIEESVAARRGRQRPSGHVFPQLFIDSFIVANSVLVRRECFTRLGGFDESLHWGDYHMWLRVALHYKVDYVDRVLTRYRQHDTQSTRASAGDQTERPPVGLQALEMILDAYPEARGLLEERAIRRRKAAIYFGLAYGAYRSEEQRTARKYLRTALRLWPTNLRFVMLYLACLLEPAHARAARAAWRRLQGRDLNVTGRIRGITN